MPRQDAAGVAHFWTIRWCRHSPLAWANKSPTIKDSITPFRSGAARAAQQSGNAHDAQQFYRQLEQQWEKSTGTTSELREARNYLKQNQNVNRQSPGPRGPTKECLVATAWRRVSACSSRIRAAPLTSPLPAWQEQDVGRAVISGIMSCSRVVCDCRRKNAWLKHPPSVRSLLRMAQFPRSPVLREYGLSRVPSTD